MNQTLIKNVRLWTMDAQDARAPGWLLIGDGKIAALGCGVPPDCENVLDGDGGVLTPGLIDIHSHLGLYEDGLGFEGAFQRLEELVSALWVLGDAALLGLLLLSLQPLLTRLAGPGPSRGRVWKVTGAVLLASLPASFWKGVLAGPVLPAGNLLAGGLIVALSTLAARREKTLKKFQKRG